MRRIGAIFRSVLLIVATVIVTTWVHQRIDRASVLPDMVDSLSDLTADSAESVTESEFERYLRILEAMQADHALAVEPAAERESLTLEQFRDVERRVQKNDALVERARESLKKKAETLWDSRRADLAKPTRSPGGPEL